MSSFSQLKSLPEVWSYTARHYGDSLALHDPHSKPEIKLTYHQLWEKIQQFAAGLQVLGIKPEDKISIFADNSPRWFIADQGTMTAGCANVVRSSQAEQQELLYIYHDSDSVGLIVENHKTLDKLAPHFNESPPQFVIFLSDEIPPENTTYKVLNFKQVLEIGDSITLQPIPKNPQDLATLIYTSGTTGQPKGAMLSHYNLLHQITALEVILPLTPHSKALSILPSWHAYERTCEYYILAHGCTLVYTNLRSLKKDLQTQKPELMVGVPRLWESIYEGIQKSIREQSQNQQKLVSFFLNISEQYIIAKRISEGLSLDHAHASAGERTQAKIKASVLSPLHQLGEKLVYQKIRLATGGNIKFLVSGGGSLARHLDTFFEIIGIPVLVGYGLTETSPVVTVRQPNHNLRGSSGRPIDSTTIAIVHPETRKPLPPWEKGLVLIKGSPVMQGYYKKESATAKAIDSEGWFDSGDLGYLTPDGDLVLTGRSKDTIVLSNGENIEPQPIEDACLRSPYIDQIMLVGQDQRILGALIVPNLDALQGWITAQNMAITLPEANCSPDSPLVQQINQNNSIQGLFRQELTREVQNRPGYRADDRIGSFYLLFEPFSQENGMMTQTLKIKRPVVTEQYQSVIDALF